MGKKLTIADVFTPGGVPSVTYVRRDHLQLEERVRNAVSRRHSFIVVTGPTKSGKSVLCRKVLPSQRTVKIEGGQIATAAEFWEHVSYHLTLPTTATKTRTRIWSWTGLWEFLLGIPATIQKKLSGSFTQTNQDAVAATYNNVLILDAVRALTRKGLSLLIEDFHYIPKDAQKAIVRALKSGVMDGLRVVILAVPHRAFDATDVEAEVGGRVHHVSVPSWSLDDLSHITQQGFKELKLSVPKKVQRRICEDGFGNPLLVQEICLNLCELLAERATNPGSIDEQVLVEVYDRLAEMDGLERFEQLAHSLPPNTEPRMVKSSSGENESLQIALLAAVARLGPKEVTSFEEIRDSLRSIMAGRLPNRANLVAALQAMTSAVAQGGAAPFEWSDARETLAITDPYLMFYMRWHLRDRRAIRLLPSALDNALFVQPSGAPRSDEEAP